MVRGIERQPIQNCLRIILLKLCSVKLRTENPIAAVLSGPERLRLQVQERPTIGIGGRGIEMPTRLWVVMVVLSVCARLVPHPWDFTPIMAIGLFAGSHDQWAVGLFPGRHTFLPESDSRRCLLYRCDIRRVRSH